MLIELPKAATAMTKAAADSRNLTGTLLPTTAKKHAAQYLGEGKGAGGQRRRGSGQTLVDVVGDLVETYPCLHHVSRHTERRQQPERPGPERLTHSKVRLYGSGL